MLLFQIKLRIIIETEINSKLIMKFILPVLLFFLVSCSLPTKMDENPEEVEELLSSCIINIDPTAYPQPLISQDSLSSLILSDLGNISYEGLIIVHFTVDELGKVNNPLVLNKDSSLIHLPLSKIKEVPFNPAFRNGQPVAVNFAFPFNLKFVD